MARLRCVPLLVTLATVVALPTTPAAAGTYKVEMCKLADGTPTPVSDWSALSQNFCANTGVNGFFGFSIGYNGAETWQVQAVTAPANTAISRADVWHSHDAPESSQSAQPRITTTWGTFGWTGGAYSGSSAQNVYDPANPGNRLSATSPVNVSVRYDCLSTGPASPDACTELTYFIMYKLDLHMADGVAPQVTGTPGGTLTSGTWLTGSTVPMSIGASDAGSGAYRAFIRSGSTSIYARLDGSNPECRDVDPAGDAYDFNVLRPCATAATEYTPSFNLRDLGDGIHSNVTIGIEDASGNETVALTAQTLRVNAPGGSLGDLGTPCAGGTYDASGACVAHGGGASGGGGGGGAGSVGPGLVSTPVGDPIPIPSVVSGPDATAAEANGTGATRAAALRVTFDGTTKREMRSTFGKTLVVTGRLATAAGTPITNARIDVFSTRAGRGATAKRESPVVTDADGNFRLALSPGPSRTIRLAYRAFAPDADYAESSELDVVVLTKAALRATPRAVRNKSSVVFHGRVSGAPSASRKVVEMQVRQDGRWLTFGTTRIRDGHFKYRYRFTRTFQPLSYVFRTIVRGETGWPYETGVSNRVKVDVRP